MDNPNALSITIDGHEFICKYFQKNEGTVICKIPKTTSARLIDNIYYKIKDKINNSGLNNSIKTKFEHAKYFLLDDKEHSPLGYFLYEINDNFPDTVDIDMSGRAKFDNFEQIYKTLGLLESDFKNYF